MDLFVFLRNGKRFATALVASLISYDNSSSGLNSTDVQAAIDEIATGTGVSVDQNLDGGFANSVYTPEQCFDGGGANG